MNKKSKVILLPCSSYREEIVYENLEIGLELLGGIEKIVKKEESILLKPNLLKKAEVDKAVITHPSVVGMFARLMREKGYQDLSLADSCGNGTTTRVIHGTGIDRYLEKYGITAIDYSKGIRVEYPEGIQAKEFILPKELLEKDCVISLCKMKTHALERITGAVKNSYGFIYGFHKAKGHTLYPSADSFARMLVDLNQYVKPRLYIMEDAVAQYGNPYFDVDRRVARSGMWERLAKALNIFQKKPYIEPERCIRCGICVKSCPVPDKAVDFRKGRENPPVYDYRKCIRCFCCQEMCPEKAIKVK